MSLLILAAALLPWAATPADVVTRTFVAISVLSVEMQIATLTGAGSLATLPWFNLIVAAAAIAWQWRREPPFARVRDAFAPAIPAPALALLGGAVLVLAMLLPFQAADPYHLEKIATIERSGTLAYSADVEPKVNLVGWLYELVLADVRQIPVAGGALARGHGLAGLALLSCAIAALAGWLAPVPRRWPYVAIAVTPVLFHQFVLVKNDLFLAIPALTALAWLITHAERATPSGTAWAGWLLGTVVASKITNYPFALAALALVVIAQRRRAAAAVGGLALGGVIGACSGGLMYSFVENAKWYGDPLARHALAEMGNVTGSVGAALASIARFAVSLFDLGLITRHVWPGRGGWGGTFGLPLIWAFFVIATQLRREPAARRALAVAVAHWLAFAAAFPDADLTHRLVLAPGLLVIGVAAHAACADTPRAHMARLALWPVAALSAAQIARSALLYVKL